MIVGPSRPQYLTLSPVTPMQTDAKTLFAELPPQGPCLFLLDARHRVEEEQLKAWLDSVTGQAGRRIDMITLSISEESEDMDIAGLSALLKQNTDTTVIPVRVSWVIPGFDPTHGMLSRHLLLGDPRAPGALHARWILMRDQKRAHCFAAEPATVGQMLERFDASAVPHGESVEISFARFVVRQAGVALDIAERGLRGSRYKVPKFVAENLRANPDFQNALVALSEQTGKHVIDLKEEADEYMQEMISKPRPIFIDMKAKLERWMLSLGYDEKLSVDPAEVERFRQIIREKPTLVLFTHKTYLDGLAATDIAYRNDMPLIHTFGGINMAMPGLSQMMRGSGGIFIRRSFRDNLLYKLVLRFYISYLLEKRFPMTWAFEGTRSRLGKLMPPRFGLLKYVIDSAYNNDIKDLHFLPVATSFELIRDVEDYAEEQAGKLKKPETLTWFLGYLRSLKKPRGKIYVNFGEPVVVPNAPDPDDKLALAKIAFQVAVQANRVSPFTLNALMCLILLGSAPRSMAAGEMQRGIAYFIEWGRERGIRMAGPLNSDDPDETEHLVGTLLDSGLFIRHDLGTRVVYSVAPNRHATASYYRNTIVHHFLDRAIIDMSLLKTRELFKLPPEEVFWEETERLRDLFKFEFFYPEKEEFRANLEAELDRIDEDWRQRLREGGMQIQSLINRCQPLVGHAVFLPLVEAYTIVLLILASLQPGETIDQKACVDLAIREGKFALLVRRITSEASIAKILFENGYQLAQHMGLTRETDEPVLGERKALLREFRDMSRRLEVARIEGLRVADKFFDEEE